MKLTFFSENKFYDRKESSLTKYCRIRSKLTVFLKFLTFPFNFQDNFKTRKRSFISDFSMLMTVP